MKKALLLVNLGSPDAPTSSAVRRYLAEFLMDERVLDVPSWLRALIVYGTILPTRPQSTAHAYQQIWTQQGSPLISISKKVAELLQEKTSLPVALGMRYGNPSIEDALKSLLRDYSDLEELCLVPLYPHYAMSSTETVIEKTKSVLAQLGSRMRLTIVPSFYQHPRYIQALVNCAQPYIASGFDHLLFSYHGLPERHLKKSDPTGCHCLTPHCCTTPSKAIDTCYKAQALETTRLFIETSGIPLKKTSVAFQSRLGRDPWIKPYTDFELVRLAEAGSQKLLVMCPAFVSDCLETLEEIGQRGKEIFIRAGGKDLVLVPCLNTHPDWIEALSQLTT